MAEIRMWTSKLGNKYPMDQIQANDVAAQKELKRLRGLRDRGNHVCADCGAQDSSWASVTHGVFVCVVCSDVHRSVGTHVTKMKGCTGTYLWGPDELEKMQTIGNHKADDIYGDRKVSPGASKEEKQRFVEDKYAKLAFASRTKTAPPPRQQVESRKCASQATSEQRIVAPVPVAAAAWQTPSTSRRDAPIAIKSSIPDSFFEDLFGEADSPKTNSSQYPRGCSGRDVAKPRCGGFDDLWADAFDMPKTPTQHTNSAFPQSLDLLA